MKNKTGVSGLEEYFGTVVPENKCAAVLALGLVLRLHACFPRSVLAV